MAFVSSSYVLHHWRVLRLVGTSLQIAIIEPGSGVRTAVGRTVTTNSESSDMNERQIFTLAASIDQGPAAVNVMGPADRVKNYNGWVIHHDVTVTVTVASGAITVILQLDSVPAAAGHFKFAYYASICIAFWPEYCVYM